MNIDYNNRGKREAQMYGGNHEICDRIYFFGYIDIFFKYISLRTILLFNLCFLFDQIVQIGASILSDQEVCNQYSLLDQEAYSQSDQDLPFNPLHH